ncbi:Scd6-like Sm domain-containing protein [Syncephalis plumigaleata]|nr:Scd6-like Sm domain-containing protein [Syncephalis plumigaleata]
MSANAFVGSRISLISKSDVRYVGILHSISTEEATVSLEQVRCFGTEGRKNNPAEELPASNNVYEFVVFRAADIKDLTVLEPPQSSQPSQPASMPHDPAIVNSPVARPPASQSAAPAQQPYNAATPHGGYPASNFGGATSANLPYGQRHPGMHPHGAMTGNAPANMGIGSSGYPQQPGHAAHWQGAAAGGQAALQRNAYGIGSYPNTNATPPGMSIPSMGGQATQGLTTANAAAGQSTRHEVSGSGGHASKNTGANGSINASMVNQMSHGHGASNAAALAGQPVTKWDPKQGVTTTTIPASGSNAKQQTGGRGTPGQGGQGHAAKKQQQQQHQHQHQHNNNEQELAIESESANNKKINNHHGAEGGKDQKTRRPRGRRGTGQQMGKQDGAATGKSTGEDGADATGAVPNTEFDFASANAKFDKATLIKEFSQLGIHVTNSAPTSTASASKQQQQQQQQQQPSSVVTAATTAAAAAAQPNGSGGDADTIVIPPPSNDTFYDRSRSFFDDISCESKERRNEAQNERRDNRASQERRVNMETFGQISIDGGGSGGRFRGGRRGGYRGRGHRGRGGAGRGNHHNNNNNNNNNNRTAAA